MRSIYLLLLVVGELHNAALAADEAPQLERQIDVIRMDSVIHENVGDSRNE
ncbi:hypothetical protein PC121_g12673 [Phytophthora cactorum]|nr:hypothetical protein PC120_g25082 [Phytophthora cactorum]KAG3062182.1 hypothetical protein PC121_g12673 [Phytophthora cactorum]KAG4039157.1 hypothetical protein PC123_g25290 [Phytophthora cactorum]